MHGWDAGQYLRFADERTRPALDLVARIDLATPRRIVDLGCGPGNSTGMLRERWSEAAITTIGAVRRRILFVLSPFVKRGSAHELKSATAS
jgi:trans-aconitate methyltransferase